MVTNDCGLTDADHSEWQAWLDIHDLVLSLHASVSDITTFVNEYSCVNEDEYGITELSDDIYALFKRFCGDSCRTRWWNRNRPKPVDREESP